MAADLGWSPSNTSTVCKRLEEQGRIHIDERGRIWVKGNVPKPRRTRDEDTANAEEGERKAALLCTYNLPERYLPYFERLDSERRAQCEHDYFLIQEWRKRIAADAIALARANGQELEERWLKAAVGYEEDSPKGRPRIERENLAVQLQLTDLPELSVHISGNGHALNSVQHSNGDSYKAENGSVRKTASLFTSEIQSLQSEVRSKPVEYTAPKAPSPPPTPTQTERKNPPKNGELQSEVLATVEELMGRKFGGKDALRGQFDALPEEFQIPVRSLCRFLRKR